MFTRDANVEELPYRIITRYVNLCFLGI